MLQTIIFYFNNILINEGEFTFIYLIFISILFTLVLVYFLFILYLIYLILKNNKFKPTVFTQARNFSTCVVNHNNKNKINNLEPMDNTGIPEKLDFDPELYPYHLESEPIEVKMEWFKQRELKKFKKAYGGGYLGYKKYKILVMLTNLLIWKTQVNLKILKV